MLEPIPAVTEHEAPYALDRLPIHHRANTERQTTITDRGNLDLTSMSFDSGRRRNSHKHRPA